MYGCDCTTAYQLLDRFVQHIRHLHEHIDATDATIGDLENVQQRTAALNRTAQEHIIEATKIRDRYRTRLGLPDTDET